jgi:hypothetical protein
VKLHVTTLYLLVQTIAVQSAFAQDASKLIDRWQRDTGIYVTRSVREQFPSYQADEFAKRTSMSDSKNREQIAGAIRRSQVQISAGFAVWRNDEGQIQRIPLDQNSNVFNSATFSAFVDKFATVHLTVKPVPPRDYQVVINGESCPATIRGLYRVSPGTTVVNVTRPKKCRAIGLEVFGWEKNGR